MLPSSAASLLATRSRAQVCAARVASFSSSASGAEEEEVPALVTAEWVARRMPSVRVVDASWYMPSIGEDTVK